MYIFKSETQIYPFCGILWFKRLDTQYNEPTNQNSVKVPKVIDLQIRKRYYKIGDYCNKRPNVPSLPGCATCAIHSIGKKNRQKRIKKCF